jgi:hypothetical protein
MPVKIPGMPKDSEHTERIDQRMPSDDAASASASMVRLDEVMKAAESLDANERLRLMAGIWASLPPSHIAAPTPEELADLKAQLDEYDDGHARHFPWAVVKQLMAGSARQPPAKIYSAPRRFDLATIFVVTLAFALLLGFMKAFSFPPATSMAIAGFILLVGIGQALLFGGKQPRTASLIVGAATYAIAMLAAWMISGPRLYDEGTILIMMTYTIVGGAILGYLAGVMVGGVFLLADNLRSRSSRKKEEIGAD